MTKHVMIDIETWGKSHNAQIISIGAVKFDPEDASVPFENFSVAIDPRSFMGSFEIDPDTVLYWMHKGRRDALDHWLSCDKLDLPSGLWGFIAWFGDESLPTWGNGATFDNVIMLNAIAKVGRCRPWTYKHDRCYRTLAALHDDVPKPTHAEMAGFLQAEVGRHLVHTALYDAQCQAVHALRIFTKVRTPLIHYAGSAAVEPRPQPRGTMAQMLEDLDREDAEPDQRGKTQAGVWIAENGAGLNADVDYEPETMRGVE